MFSRGRQIEIKGLSLLIAKLQRIGYSIESGLGSTTKKAKDEVYNNIPAYPPPPTGSRYSRTYELGRSFQSEVRPLGDNVVASISSTDVKAPFVVGERTQARIHRGRWWTLESVLRNSRDKVVEVYKQAIKRFMNV